MLYHSKRKRDKKAKQKVAARLDATGRPKTAETVRRLLLIDRKWKLILQECLAAAMRDNAHGEFAGTWVIQAIRAQGGTPPSNLRTLSALGLLTLVKTTRAGNRAYYVISDARGLEKALASMQR